MRAATLLLSLLLTTVASLAAAQDAPREFTSKSARIERASGGRPLTGPSAATAADVVRQYLRGRHADATLQSLVVARQNPTPTALHLVLEQEVAGLRVHGAYARASLSARGELLTVIDQLVPVPALVPERIGARDALASVLRRHYPQAAVPAEARAAGNEFVFETSQLFPDAPTVTRVAVPMANGALHAGYLVVTWDRNNMLRHTVVGGDGRVLAEELRTNTDSYKIFPKQPDLTPQTVVNGPGMGNAQSPSGWVSGTTTIGNNADAYLDRDNNNAADTNGRPVSPTSGKDASFVFTADLTQAPTATTNQMAGVTNLFYLNNVIHDKLYKHGFTESAGNFQTNNFGKGGAGNDPVNAETQDGGGTNNANFATPADGSRPRMQMYLWTYSTPNRDGDLDSDIVYHEYGHGLTWRMIGSMTGPLAGAIGEGMSDTLAIYLNNNDRVGEYSYNNPLGIRRNPYTNYPRTYGDVAGSSVHNDGEIYAATMWKLRQLWLGKGYTEDRLFDFVVDGMNHTPARPAYEDMRNGILSSISAAGSSAPADAACTVWQAFAQFGIGEGADGVESCRVFCRLVSVTESFAVPASCSGTPSNTAPTVTITSPSGGTFTQGTVVTFSGTASDQQDGDLTGSLAWMSSRDGQLDSGGSFSRSDLSVGTHTITASVTDNGGLTGSASVTITIASSSGITLSTRGYKVKGVQTVDLTWSGASGGDVDVFRNGSRITTTANDGAHTDNIGAKGGGTYTYKVCETGTSTCANDSVVVF